MPPTRPKKLVLAYIVIASLLLPRLGVGQSSTALPKPRSDRQQEDAVAKLFDAVRKEANLPPLTRIEDRRSLQQLTCTVAITGTVPRFHSNSPVLGNDSTDGITRKRENGQPKADTPSALYKTASPGELTEELKRVALLERPIPPDGHFVGHKRYSVAVWPAQSVGNEKPEYWVGIQLFWSAGAEFFENHFTDAIEWKNEWKQFVTPECKHVK